MRLMDVLELSTFKDADVVAGRNGVTNTVQSVNLMNEDGNAHEIHSEQLMLSTGYSMKKTPHVLVNLVKEMAEKGAAGLGLKIKHFNEEIPKEVLEIANQLHFPIIKLPLDYSLGEMLHEALGRILKMRTHELNFAMKIHRQFTDIVIAGGGFSKIIHSLTNILDVPVILLNDRLDIMAYSHDIHKDSFFDIYWYIHETIHQEEIDQYKVLRMPNDARPTYDELSIYPVQLTNQLKGYIIILGSSLRTDYPFTLALEQAANVISFEFMKIHAIEQHARRIKNQFFTDLVEGTMTSKDEILNKGNEYHLIEDLQYNCITAKMDAESDFYIESETDLHSKRDRVYELIESLLASQYETSIIFNKGDLITILIGLHHFNEEVEKNILDTLQMIQIEVYESLHISISFGISNATEPIPAISTCFQEAVEALRSGYRESNKRFIKTYRMKELTELFNTIPSHKLKEFYQSTLKELAFPEDKEKEDLVNTLSIYLNNHCQIAETAKSMLVHRNTVIYRVKKCEKILRVDLKGDDDSLRLRMALFLRAHSYHKTQ